MKKKLVMLLSLLCSLTTLASDEVDYMREMAEEDYKTIGIRLHKAQGEHLCQSHESIGHKCSNLGVNFSDCQQAFLLLKRDDCCSGSQYGGRSIAFKITSCSSYL